MKKPTVNLVKIMKEIKFDIIHMPDKPENIFINSKNISRMGMEFIDSLSNFDDDRVMIIGQSENHFLNSCNNKEIKRSINNIFKHKPLIIICTCGLEPLPQVIEIAKENKIPLLISKSSSSELFVELYSFLDIHLAPKITRSAGLLNIHGEGVLITGASGIGKSEASLELLKRGHRLISDDLIEIRKIGKNTLLGNAPKNVKHFMEIRGIGFINARRIFGVGAVKYSETIDLVVNLEVWDESKIYDRIGEKTVYTEILGVKVPYVSVPVRPGRNLAVIIEVAAMNNRQKELGFNAAKELFINLEMEGVDADPDSEPVVKKCIWDI